MFCVLYKGNFVQHTALILFKQLEMSLYQQWQISGKAASSEGQPKCPV